MNKPFAVLCLFLMATVGALAVAEPSANAQSIGRCSTITASPDGWEGIIAPEFPSGDDEIVAYAVSHHQPSLMLVTNGRVIMRSLDGGCTFREVFDLATGGGPLTTGRTILGLEIPRSSSGADLVFATVVGPNGLSPEVFRSRDSGATWSVASSGLPPLGMPMELEIADADPARLYLLLSIPPTTQVALTNADVPPVTSAVFSSANGGDSWEQASDPMAAVAGGSSPLPSEATDLAVDPLLPQTLWLASSNGVARSEDGGSTWVELEGVTSPIDVLTVSRVSGSPAQNIVAFSATSADTYWSEDGGESWEGGSSPGPEAVESAASTPVGTFISIDSDEGMVFRGSRMPDAAWVPRTFAGLGRPTLRDLSSVGSAQARLYAQSGAMLWRSSSDLSGTTPPLPTGFIPQSAPTECIPEMAGTPGELTVAPVEHAVPTLTSSESVVELSPGDEKVVRFNLDLPPRAVLDADIVVDTTSSMGPTICGIRKGLQDIVQSLASQGIDLQIGLADFKDYPIAPFGEPTDYAYRRVRKIGVPNDQLMAGIAELKVGGGLDSPEAQLPALFQAATGDGQTITEGVSSPGDIPQGQGAEFRPDALPVVLIVSDNDWHEEDSYPGPTWSETVDALRRRGIQVVGISVGQLSRSDMLRMAAETGAIAASPVDCNDDGDFDLYPGRELVCTVASGSEIDGMGPAITELLKSLKDLRPVRLTERSESGWITSIDPGVYPRVNVNENSSLTFDVNFHCSHEKVGISSTTEFVADVAGQAVAKATTLVSCSNRVIEAQETLDIAGPLPPPAPPAPAVNAPSNQPNLNPQPRVEPQAQQQFQQQSQAQAQGAAAPQRQEQPQMAFVHAARSVQEQAGYAMVESPAGRGDPLAAAKYGLAAGSAVLMLAFVFVRTATQRQLQHIRRRG